MPLDGTRLLFINIYFAPEVTGIAPYNLGLTSHLAAQGAAVTAITGMPHFPQWKTWLPYRARLRAREDVAGVELRRVRHFSAAGDSVLGRALYEGTFLAQALATRVSPPGPDAVLAVIPNLTSGVAAALHAQRAGAPFGVLVQDLSGSATTQSGLPGGERAAAPVRAVEGWILRQATRVAVISDSFRAPAEQAGADPERIVTLPNWSHVPAPAGDRGGTRDRLGWPPGFSVVLHAGNMGFKQYLDNVLHTARLAKAQGHPLLFVLMGDGSQRARLEAEARGMDNVKFLDLQPNSQFTDVLAAADVLLVNERATVRDMSLPSKITSYFRAGRPVVAAVPSEGSTAHELARSGGAQLVPPEEPQRLLDALATVLDDANLRTRLVECGREYVETTLDRHAVLRQAERFVEDVLAGATTGPRPR